MKIKLSFFQTLIFVLPTAILLNMIACGEKTDQKVPKEQIPTETGTEEPTTEEPAKEQSTKGVGEVKDVKLTDPLDAAMVKNGQMIYDLKCNSCHKLSDERVVGPGWAGITNRRTPEWIMNMITNVDMMLAEDAQAQALLEQCLVRMPNQNVSVGDAREILEFMRDNDMKTVKSKDQAVKK